MFSCGRRGRSGSGFLRGGVDHAGGVVVVVAEHSRDDRGGGLEDELTQGGRA